MYSGNFSGLFSVLLLGVVVVSAILFHTKQNAKAASGAWVGGPISWPKAFWLMYAIGSWFFLPFAFLGNVDLAETLRVVLWVHTIVWWIRGPLELVMIYRWFNWSPIYGISHDIVHNVLIGVGTALALSHLGWEALSGVNFYAFLYLGSLSLAMIAEAVFAALFIATRAAVEKGKAQSEIDKIYFAADTKEYRMINRLTAVICVLVYAHWIFQCVGLFLL